MEKRRGRDMDKAQAMLPRDRLLPIKYEDLVFILHAVFDQATSFLGLSCDKQADMSMLSADQYAEYYSQSWMAKSTGLIDVSLVDAWITEYFK